MNTPSMVHTEVLILQFYCTDYPYIYNAKAGSSVAIQLLHTLASSD
jgi:hypothetical protein